jgi:small subunit ribosomal protein S9
MTDIPASAPAASGFDTLRELTGAPLTGDSVIVREPKIDAQGRAYATGKRKNAIARVWIKPGSGRITINDRDQEVISPAPCCA